MKLIAATNNNGKLEEFRRILGPLGIQVLSPKEVGVESQAEENGDTFAENARIKAREIFEKTGLPTLADDSGLCVDALDGRPGVYSARYCGEDTPYDRKMAALLEELAEAPRERRTARFVCHISCILAQEEVLECEGSCEGWIGYAPAGSGGFGYDPLFFVGEESYAQLAPQEKDRLSHRGIALRQLYQKLSEYCPERAGEQRRDG